MATRVNQEAVAEMIRLYGEGYSVADIQRLTGRNTDTVRKHLRRSGVSIDPMRMSKVVPHRLAVRGADGSRLCSTCRTAPAVFDGKNWHRCAGCKRAYMREYHRTSKYGLRDEDFAILLDAQGGTCAICSRTEPLVVDHDHATGRVRGILCHKHNVAVGLLGDSLSEAERAVEYLRGTP